MLAAIVLVACRAFLLPDTPIDILAGSDNDNIMRFLSVRDLIAGQSWFDMTQYRILPPHGLPLHWSRFVDLGIAAMIGSAALFVPMEAAEGFAIVAWPMLMLCLLILVIGLQGRKVFGPAAAALAVVAIIVWPVTTATYFRAGRLDHHNVQIILTTLMLIALIRPGSPRGLGILAGLAAGASLSVGLETLPLVGLAGVVLAVRALGDMRGDGTRLLAFSAALTLGCLVPYVAQTAPSAWADPYCDQLSPPSLALVTTALVASFVLVLCARRWSLPVGIAGFCVVVGTGLFLSAPLLLPCLDGPYAILPDEVRVLIFKIREVQPAHWFLVNSPAVFFENVAPALGAIFAGALVWLRRRARGLADRTEDRAVATLLLFATLTTAGTFVQVRLVVLTASSVPLLVGYTLGALLTERFETPTRAGGLALIATVLATLMPPSLHHFAETSGLFGSASAEGSAPSNCRTPDRIRSLDTVAPGLVLHPINLGPPMMLLTNHSALSATYHRRPEALVNGILPYTTDEAGLREALARSGADYLLVCRNSDQAGDSFVATLAAGGTAPGLTRVPGPDPEILLFRVE